MAGNPYTAADINNRAGSLVYGVWQALDAARQFKLWLDDSSHNDTALGPSGSVGVPTADLTIIRNSFADLGGTSGLWAVAHGTFAPAGASNYFSNAKLLSGLNYTG
jgi:hypothetical protein